MADDPSWPGPLDALDAPRLRWLISRDIEQASDGSRSVPSPNAGTLTAWFAAFLPVLFTGDIRYALQGRLAHTASTPLAFHAAWFELASEPDSITAVIAAANHHSSAVRRSAYRALALVADALPFDHPAFQLVVEDCIREHYVDADHASVLLLAGAGDPGEKRRWASAQLVRHAGHARPLAEVLEAAANCRPVPNTLLSEMLRMSLSVASSLAISAGALPFPGAEGTADDWAQRDIFTLGQDLWPRLLQDRIAAHPLFQPFLDLEERVVPLDRPANRT